MKNEVAISISEKTTKQIEYLAFIGKISGDGLEAALSDVLAQYIQGLVATELGIYVGFDHSSGPDKTAMIQISQIDQMDNIAESVGSDDDDVSEEDDPSPYEDVSDDEDLGETIEMDDNAKKAMDELTSYVDDIIKPSKAKGKVKALTIGDSLA